MTYEGAAAVLHKRLVEGGQIHNTKRGIMLNEAMTRGYNEMIKHREVLGISDRDMSVMGFITMNDKVDVIFDTNVKNAFESAEKALLTSHEAYMAKRKGEFYDEYGY